MPSQSRLQVIATLGIGALMLLFGFALDILSHYQALDYLQLHWGTAYDFLNSEKTHTVLILVGIGMIGFAVLRLKQSPPTPEHAAQPAPTPQKQEMNNSGNFKQENNPTFNIYGPPPPIASPAQAILEDLPLLEFQDAEEIFLYHDHACMKEINNGTYVGLVAVFKNAPQAINSRNIDATNVVGNIEYISKSGKSLNITSSWVGCMIQGLLIQAGRTQKLIIAFRNKTDIGICALQCQNRFGPSTRNMRSLIFSMERMRPPVVIPLSEDLKAIRIILIGNRDHTLFDGLFDFEISAEGRMILTRNRGNG